MDVYKQRKAIEAALAAAQQRTELDEALVSEAKHLMRTHASGDDDQRRNRVIRQLRESGQWRAKPL